MHEHVCSVQLAIVRQLFSSHGYSEVTMLAVRGLCWYGFLANSRKQILVVMPPHVVAPRPARSADAFQPILSPRPKCLFYRRSLFTGIAHGRVAHTRHAAVSNRQSAGRHQSRYIDLLQHRRPPHKDKHWKDIRASRAQNFLG